VAFNEDCSLYQKADAEVAASTIPPGRKFPANCRGGLAVGPSAFGPGAASFGKQRVNAGVVLRGSDRAAHGHRTPSVLPASRMIARGRCSAPQQAAITSALRGISDYLTNGGRIEVARLYDRRNGDISVGAVERIAI